LHLQRVFFNTSDISQKRINYFFADAINHETRFPRGPCKRKGGGRLLTPDETLQQMRNHRNAFPRM
jgi:hypothetical protein